jgi:uncharacterized integral membrane protein
MSGNSSAMTDQEKHRLRPYRFLIVSALMIIFGLAEISTAYSRSFFGISAQQAPTIFTFSGAVIGALYAVAGLFVLTMKKWAATLAIGLLLVVIVGRILLVAAGIYPVNTFENAFGIILGTAIAAVFAIYIGLKRNSFRP